MQTHNGDWKFWLEETVHFVGEILYGLGEYLAGLCYFILLIVNMCSSNLHNDSVEDERQRLYEQQKRQRFLEEEEREQLEFEERQRLYALRFGNWRERHLAAITTEERLEAETARDLRGVQLEIRHSDGRTAVATASRIDQLKFDSGRNRKRIAQLYSDVDYFRHQERSRGEDRHDWSRQIRDSEREIANLERVESQTQFDLQNVSL
jgi:hypothetical protein